MQKCFDISPLLICFLGAFTQLFSGCYRDCSLTLIKHDAILFFLSSLQPCATSVPPPSSTTCDG